MKSSFRNLFAAAAFVLAVSAGALAAEDKWFVLGEQDIQDTNPSVTIKSVGGRWDKDVKQVKIMVQGADVTVTKLVLGWDNRRDDTMDNIGTIKAGGETAPFNAPGIKGRLQSATIYYTIGGGKKTAHVQIMGYD